MKEPKILRLGDLINRLNVIKQSVGESALVFCGEVQSGDRVLVDDISYGKVMAEASNADEAHSSYYPAKPREIIVEIHGTHAYEIFSKYE